MLSFCQTRDGHKITDLTLGGPTGQGTQIQKSSLDFFYWGSIHFPSSQSRGTLTLWEGGRGPEHLQDC